MTMRSESEKIKNLIPWQLEEECMHVRAAGHYFVCSVERFMHHSPALAETIM
jgi:hypothetical protein